MILMILMGIFMIASTNSYNVGAQTTCRTASNAVPARAFLTRIGVNLWQLRWQLNSQHTMHCGDFFICNRDKFAKKETLNVNVVNASAAGFCNEFHQFNHIVNFNHFEYATKIKFQENSTNNPKRIVVILSVNLGISTYSEMEEYEVTDFLTVAEDDGDDN
jgi:hypothetical protein